MQAKVVKLIKGKHFWENWNCCISVSFSEKLDLSDFGISAAYLYQFRCWLFFWYPCHIFKFWIEMVWLVRAVLSYCNLLDTAFTHCIRSFNSKLHSFVIYRGPNANSFDLKYNGNNNRPPIPNFNSNYQNPYLSKHFFGQHEKYAAKDRVSIGGGKFCMYF